MPRKVELKSHVEMKLIPLFSRLAPYAVMVLRERCLTFDTMAQVTQD